MNDSSLNAVGSGSVRDVTRAGAGGSAPPAVLTIPELLLTQSGQIGQDGKARPIIPGLDAIFGPGYFTSLELTSLDASHVNTKRTYRMDANGAVVIDTRGPPLGASSPMELALIGKDGARYVATIDISPDHIHWSGQAYQQLSKIQLHRVDAPPPPPPPAPDTLTVPAILVSQSGSIAMPEKRTGKPLIPGLPPGSLSSITITGLDPSNVHPHRSYRIDENGVLGGKIDGNYLGSSYPYEVTITAKDGTKYSAVVDVSVHHMHMSTQGYFELDNLKFHRVDTRAEAKSNAPLDDAAKQYARTGAGLQQKPQPRIDRSPAFFYLSQRE